MSPLISAVEKESLSVPLSSVQLIFSNIAQIHKVNSQFLASLDERVSAWQVEQTLGDLFIEVVRIFPFFPFGISPPLFRPFCSNRYRRLLFSKFMIITEILSMFLWKRSRKSRNKLPLHNYCRYSSFIVFPCFSDSH